MMERYFLQEDPNYLPRDETQDTVTLLTLQPLRFVSKVQETSINACSLCNMELLVAISKVDLGFSQNLTELAKK